MNRQVIHTDAAPKALGPYSQAIVAHDVVYCSGQIGIDPAVGEVVSGGVQAQTRQVFANLQAVLKAANSGLEEAVKCTVYLKSMGDFAAVNEIYAEYFQGDLAPARATVEVSCLPMSVDVEIDCIALVQGK